MLNSLKVGFFRWFYRFSTDRAWKGHAAPMTGSDVTLNAPSGNLPARVYHGSDAASRPLVLYIHGGGWVIGDLKTHDHYCACLADASGATVVALDYRLAPEHPFPAAQDDALAAANALLDNPAITGPHNGQLLLAGDSAGGHLSLTTTLEADESLREKICAVIATYPVVNHCSADYPSYVERATGQALTTSIMVWFWNNYLGGTDPDSSEAQRAYPIRSDRLAGLPPVLLCTCERDPLRDEGRAMVDALREAGVSVDYTHYPDSEHGFACSQGPTPDYQDWLRRCADWIRQAR